MGRILGIIKFRVRKAKCSFSEATALRRRPLTAGMGEAAGLVVSIGRAANNQAGDYSERQGRPYEFDPVD